MRFPYAKAAKVLPGGPQGPNAMAQDDTSADIITSLDPKSKNLAVKAQWRLKNTSRMGWDYHKGKKYFLYTTMVEP